MPLTDPGVFGSRPEIVVISASRCNSSLRLDAVCKVCGPASQPTVVAAGSLPWIGTLLSLLGTDIVEKSFI